MTPLRIALVHSARIPVRKYGGTERVVWWLAKALAELGHRVVLSAAEGSTCPYAETIVPFSSDRPVEQQVPDADVYHYHIKSNFPFEAPSLMTLHGNGQPGEQFPQNTVFLCSDHARRHGGEVFVFHGIDPEDYPLGEGGPSLLFLGKSRWHVKNVRGAIRIARGLGESLEVAGGGLSWLPRWRGVRWHGMVDDGQKRALLQRTRGLLFPVLWPEPFGLAVVESMLSGTPVLASPFGSLPELVTAPTGRICRTYTDFFEHGMTLQYWDRKACREEAVKRFHFHRMAQDYVGLYRRVIGGEVLHQESPQGTPYRAATLPE